MKRNMFKAGAIVVLIGVLVLVGIVVVFNPTMVLAHCDTMDGPVVTTAKMALDKGDITPVLKWVKKDSEEEIKILFKKTLAIRGKCPDVKEIADMYFFETLVRLHRAGEGALYTGLKPAGTPIEPAVALADKSLETGSVDNLVKTITQHIGDGIRERFDKAVKAKKHTDESVEAGREFVADYVEFVHYVEGIHQSAAGLARHHGEEHKDIL
jgi:hypothetical protein